MKEISSREHPLVKYWVSLMQNGKARKEEKRVLLEGKNCIQDIAKTKKIRRLISCTATSIEADEHYLVTESVMQKISSTENPEGFIAELDMPENAHFADVKKIVVFDRIQDPGNLGSLIRSALAFGWDGAFFLPGTCDPYNDKALRAAKGATFLLPLAFGSWDELAKIANITIVVADIKGKPPSSYTGINMALVLGNEAKGVDCPVPHEKVTLKMQGEMESLNVAQAGSILLYLYQEGI